ncbi:ABC transporter permease [Roseibium sp. M-1]
MLNLIRKRVWSAITLIMVASVLCFTLISAFPGNVAVIIAEQRSAHVTSEIIEQIEAEYNLDKSVIVRYGYWIADTVQGNFGQSLRTGEKVSEALAGRVQPTLTLIFGGSLVALLVGATFSFLGALRPGSGLDHGMRAIALLGASLPKFFLAALLVYLFGVIFRVLPTYGYSGPSSWILPALAIGIVPGALISRVTRVALEDAMSKPYVTTAVAKGASRTRILIRDALPNVVPVVVNAFGLHFAFMVQAAIVIEPIFAWQGMASYFIDAVRYRDFQVLQSTLLLFSVFFILVNLTVDLIVITVDPKQRRPRRH